MDFHQSESLILGDLSSSKIKAVDLYYDYLMGDNSKLEEYKLWVVSHGFGEHTLEVIADKAMDLASNTGVWERHEDDEQLVEWED